MAVVASCSNNDIRQKRVHHTWTLVVVVNNRVDKPLHGFFSVSCVQTVLNFLPGICKQEDNGVPTRRGGE